MSTDRVFTLQGAQAEMDAYALAQGEIGVTTDTKKLYFGHADGNVDVSNTLLFTKIINIPEDYQTIIDAIEDLSTIQNKNKLEYNILLSTGHTIKKGIKTKNGDFSKFIISSVDAMVNLDVGFVGVTAEGDAGTNHLFVGESCYMPRLNCLIDMGLQGGDGYYGNYGCSGYVAPDCGVNNAGRYGLHFRNGFCFAQLSSFQGSEINARIQHGAVVSLQQAIISGSTDANYGNIRASRCSTVHMQGATSNDSAGSAILALRSIINAQDCECKNNGKYAIDSRLGSKIMCNGVDADNNVGGLYALDGAFITMNGGNVLNCTTPAVVLDTGSRISISNIDITGSLSASGAITIDGSSILQMSDVVEDSLPVLASRTNAIGFNNITSKGVIMITDNRVLEYFNEDGSIKHYRFNSDKDNMPSILEVGNTYKFKFKRAVSSFMSEIDVTYNNMTASSAGEYLRKIFNATVNISTLGGEVSAVILARVATTTDVVLSHDGTNYTFNVEITPTADTILSTAWSVDIEFKCGRGINGITYIDMEVV